MTQHLSVILVVGLIFVHTKFGNFVDEVTVKTAARLSCLLTCRICLFLDFREEIDVDSEVEIIFKASVDLTLASVDEVSNSIRSLILPFKLREFVVECCRQEVSYVE